MSVRRREVELTVEHALGPLPSSGTVVRLSTRFEVGDDGKGPSHGDLLNALQSLKADLEALVNAPIAAVPAARTDREVNELVETYRPRQKDLVDLLLADGEITPAEHRVLIDYLGYPAPDLPEPPPARPAPAVTDAPIAAMPIAAERPSEPGRPVAELLATYQITSLKQAGAVRARRQISFGEYMALKRHFEQESKPLQKADQPTK